MARAAAGRAAGARAAATATARVAAPLGPLGSPLAGPTPPDRTRHGGPAGTGTATATRLQPAGATPGTLAAPPALATSPPPAGAAPPPGSRTRRLPVLLAAALGVVIMLGSCTIFAYRLVQDELAGQDAQAQAQGDESPAPVERDISTREADPEPLTVKEVFPDKKIVINPEEPPYRVLRTQKSKDCTVAAADALGDLIEELGCNHVVRATLRSPDKDYLISGGIFNLKSEADAERVYEQADAMIEEDTGRFLGLLAGDETQPILLSQTNAGWDYRGHFVIYLIIARADGEPLTGTDNGHSQVILYDIAEVHLRTNVLDGRAFEPAPGASPDAGA